MGNGKSVLGGSAPSIFSSPSTAGENRTNCPHTEESQRKTEWTNLSHSSGPCRVVSTLCAAASNYNTALQPHNYCKNRYNSVLAQAPPKTSANPSSAVESSRVRLNSDYSDYINANYVDGIHKSGKRAYIATQAPLPDTFQDFWQMIWENNSSIIVMLTRLQESGKLKADRYWPCGHKTKRYGYLTVQLVTIDVKPAFKVKQFIVQHDNGETRPVYQFHFLKWPDHDVPTDPTELLGFVAAVDQLAEQQKADNNGVSTPLVIHCSAGIGRTGAFMVVHSVLHKLRDEGKSTNDIDMEQLVRRMRGERAGILTQFCQYSFCCRFINAALQYQAALGASGLNSLADSSSSISTASSCSPADTEGPPPSLYASAISDFSDDDFTDDDDLESESEEDEFEDNEEFLCGSEEFDEDGCPASPKEGKRVSWTSFLAYGYQGSSSRVQ